MDLIDTHCHLNFKAFDGDFIEVAKKSYEKGVKKIIIVGSDVNTSEKAIQVAKQINSVIASFTKQSEFFANVSIGTHPIHALGADFEKIQKLSSDPLVVALGESGLDFYHDKERKTKNEQIELFKKHIELAIATRKPLIVHNRLADNEVREIIEEYPRLKKAVFHCFSSDHHMARWVIEKGFYLSFTGNITYGNKKIKKAIERTPIERIMVETDAPYMVPEPLRSKGIKRCEPYMCEEVIKKIALTREIDKDALADQVDRNSKKFFNL